MATLVLKFAIGFTGSSFSKTVILTNFELEPFSFVTVRLTV